MPADEFIFTSKTLVRILFSRRNYISDHTGKKERKPKSYMSRHNR